MNGRFDFFGVFTSILLLTFVLYFSVNWIVWKIREKKLIGHLPKLPVYRFKTKLWYRESFRHNWLISLCGKPIASLKECRLEDMFWSSYTIIPIVTDSDILNKFKSEEFWRNCEAEGLEFVTDPYYIPSPCAFPAWDPHLQENRILIRGLYLPIGIGFWEAAFLSLIVFVRKVFRMNPIQLNLSEI